MFVTASYTCDELDNLYTVNISGGPVTRPRLVRSGGLQPAALCSTIAQSGPAARPKSG